MSTHTPGPWLSHDKLTHSEIVTNEHGSTVVAEVYTEADAHLIATAPELLEALSTSIYLLSESELDLETALHRALEHMQAAIAKAKGESV